MEEKVLKVLSKGPLNTRKLRTAVGGNHELFDKILEEMVGGQRVSQASGMGRERLYSLPGGEHDPFS